MLFKNAPAKVNLYLKAAIALHSFNIRGYPLLPKTRYSASNRSAYNTFLLWLADLSLSGVKTIFDVGANNGDFAAASSAFFPEANVWLFEPLPFLWPRLEALADRRGSRWNLQKVALGAESGRLPLHVSETDDSIGSFLGFGEEYRHGNVAVAASKAIEVDVVPLAQICQTHEIRTIDLVKIDVEGFEFEVLAGAANFLKNIRALIVEVSLIRCGEGGRDGLSRMISLLAEEGFHIVKVIPSLFSPNQSWKPLEYNILARR